MAMRAGNPAGAIPALRQLTATGRASVDVWLLMAQAWRQLGREEEEEQALERVLMAEPQNLRALLMRGDALGRRGDDRAAASFWSLAIRLGGDAPQLTPALTAELKAAQVKVDASTSRFAEHMRNRLASEGHDAEQVSARFAESLDILAGSKQLYHQQPSSFFFPRLPAIPFFERHQFPWAAAIESATPAIVAELRAVLAADHALRPYIQPEPNRPTPRHVLLEDTRWSAFDLIKNGEIVEANASRCPNTMAALAQAPLAMIPGRSPMALFSVLKPGTRIPPHTGLLNTRLICHLPLILPEDCGLRVANETRHWRLGELLIFDDSIEHEAWNNSTETRVVLIFEIWRPDLSAAERAALTALFESVVDYGSEG